MNMKKITLGCSILVAGMLFIIGCNKKTNVAPEQDMEFQSSKDASFANSIITEIDIIASYLGENLLSSGYFSKISANGSITTNRDTLNKKLTVIYSGSVTCRDGKKRNGSIIVDYSPSNATFGSKFYRDAGFVAKVTLNNYWVDGWFVNGAAPFVITNNAPINYPVASTKLSWTLDGYFSILPENLADTSAKKMVWKGKLIKTLLNTQDPAILNPTKLNSINWVIYSQTSGAPVNGALVAYTGSVTGVTKYAISYAYVVDETKPDKAIVRDFKCAPERISAVSITPTLTTSYSEWHPFISGVASFTSFGQGTTEPRVIDYASGEAGAPCDNAGTVTIKGISYNIDFAK